MIRGGGLWLDKQERRLHTGGVETPSLGSGEWSRGSTYSLGKARACGEIQNLRESMAAQRQTAQTS